MIYSWKISGLYSVSAQEAGTEIEKCRDVQGFIVPQNVVEIAKSTDSILHKCFEWNDEIAAEKYRTDQASKLIRCIVTTSLDAENGRNTVRAFVNIVNVDKQGYKRIDSVKPDEFEYILSCALKELQNFKSKYSSLKELSGVLSAISKVLPKGGNTHDNISG